MYKNSIVKELDAEVGLWTNNKFSTFEELCNDVKDYTLPATSYVSYHSYDNHVKPMIDYITNPDNCFTMSRKALALFALFHDFEYIPDYGIGDQLKSAIRGVHEYIDPKYIEKYDLISLINDTSYLNPVKGDHIFLDLMSFHSNDKSIHEIELSVYEEYVKIPFAPYKKLRIKALKHIIPNIPLSLQSSILSRIEFLKTWTPNIGLFVGSFNPYHIGHHNVYMQADKVFDIVIIAKGVNTCKCDHLNQAESTIPQNLSHLFATYTTTLSDFTKLYGTPTIIRGLRDGFDLSYEQRLKQVYNDLGGNCDFVYYLTDSSVSHVSSSMVRGLDDQFGEITSSKYLVRW